MKLFHKCCITVVIATLLAILLSVFKPVRAVVATYVVDPSGNNVVVSSSQAVVTGPVASVAVLESDTALLAKYKLQLQNQILVGSYPYSDGYRRYIYVKPNTNEFTEVTNVNMVTGTYDAVCAEPRLRIHFSVFDNDGNEIHRYGSDAAQLVDSTRNSILFNVVCKPTVSEPSEKETLEAKYAPILKGYTFVGTYPVTDQPRRYMYTSEDNKFVSLMKTQVHIGSFKLDCTQKTVVVNLDVLDEFGSKEEESFKDTSAVVSDSSRPGILFTKYCKE